MMLTLVYFMQERLDDILRLTLEHLRLTGIAVFLAILTAVPLGILLTRVRRLASPVLGFASVIQTIPSLALFGFLLPFIGIGVVPAVVALFLYSLLVIIRNTYTSLSPYSWLFLSLEKR